MRSICGWSGCNPTGSEDLSIVQRMGERMLRGNGSPKSLHGARNAVCVDSKEAQDRIAARDGMLAAISGDFEWRDAELRAVAERDGAGQALLHGYAQKGTDVLCVIAGAFSAVVTTDTGDVRLLATDRTGSQPVAYAEVDGGIVFGPDARTLQAHPQVGKNIVPQAIFDYIYFHFVPSPESVFERVQRLLPGQSLAYRNGKLSISTYWSPHYDERYAGHSFDDLRDELRSLVRESVRQAVDGKKAGAFLSGGVDSTTITGVMSEVLEGQPVRTYSIGFDVEGYDELSYARIAARHFGAEHTEYLVTPQDIVEAVPQIARYYAEPFGNSSAVPSLCCARLARQDGIEVLLGGDGGDELFGGNERYAKQKLFDFYARIPGVLRKGVLEPLLTGSRFGNSVAPIRKARSYVEQALVPMPERLQTYNFLNRFTPDQVFERSFLETISEQHPLSLLTGVYDNVRAESIVDKMLGLDLKFTLADNDLVKVGGACDLAGVAVAYPLLSDKLLEFSAGLPPAMKVKGQVLRHFFKKAYTGFLPEQTLSKSKHGFGLPFGEWAVNDPALSTFVRDNVATLKARKLFRSSFVDEVMEKHLPEYPQYYGTIVWLFLMLEQWQQASSATVD